MRWKTPEEPWQYRILDLLPPSFDKAHFIEARKLTPTERLKKVQEMGRFVDEAKRSRLDRNR